MPKKTLSIVTSLIFSANAILMAVVVPQAEASFEPYQKTFIVTAYYSPLPGQSFYVTGSLASDKRLNGNGTHGADGTPVYPGMIAAPGTYSFGTRVSCPGYIDGEIHDRGGAIVKAGERGYAHDRLDFWAGEGEDALRTALYWGKRTLTCTVYPPGYSGDFQQYVSLPNTPTNYGSPQKATATVAKNYSAPTYSGISSHYKNILTELGYDPEDKAARIAFQIRHNIIDSPEEGVAGNVGPSTKSTLDNIKQSIDEKTPRQGLQLGDTGPDVRQLQEILIQEGYLNTESTAIFAEQTQAALIQFQLDHQLIESTDHPAAGYLGPGTQALLKEKALSEFMVSESDKQLIATLNKDKIAAESLAKANQLDEPEVTEESPNLTDENLEEMLKALSEEWIKEHTPENNSTSMTPQIQLASAKIESNDQLVLLKEKLTPLINPFEHHFQLGSTGAEVEKIQQLLQELGYFEGIKITNYFGPQTQQAIAKFQVDTGVVESTTSPGAGIVGPKTILALNASYYQHEFALPFQVSNSVRAPAINPEDIKAPALQQAQKTTTASL